MAGKHIVKSYDDKLDVLRSKVLEMGRDATNQLSKAIEALVTRDDRLADTIIKDDSRVNTLQNEIDQFTIGMLATRQPMALDLRGIVSGLKIASDLERIADYSANIARSMMDLDHVSLEKPLEYVFRMADLAKEMLEDVMEAYRESNSENAIDVWHRDDNIDRLYSELLGQMGNFMSQDTEHGQAYTGLLLIARSFERMGDHITNIAECVHYIERGQYYAGNPCE